MMPLSYQGFGFTAILLMLGVLIINQVIRFLKDYFHKNNQKQKASEFLYTHSRHRTALNK
jgi:hypothetical protein